MELPCRFCSFVVTDKWRACLSFMKTPLLISHLKPMIPQNQQNCVNSYLVKLVFIVNVSPILENTKE